MNFLLVGIIGLIIGSFLNVCIYRIPREESICYPPSHCEICNHRLYFKDLVPFFSYIFLNGKCRYCREKISLRYLIIEILNSMLFISIYIKFGFTEDTIKYCFFASLLIVIAFIDHNTQNVYNSTIIFGVAAGIVFLILEKAVYDISPIYNIAGFVLGVMLIGLLVFLTRGMGEGDIGIAALCGLFLGAKLILINLFLAIFIGGIIGAVILLFKLKNKKDSMAFGPSLALGAFISMLFGNMLIDKYFEMFL